MAGMVRQQAQSSLGDWPELPLSDWADICATLHLWTQERTGEPRVMPAIP